jgi:hypothetical protein
VICYNYYVDKFDDECKAHVCAGHDVRVEGSSPSWADIERSIS